MSGAPKGGLMSNCVLSPAANKWEMEPSTDIDLCGVNMQVSPDKLGPRLDCGVLWWCYVSQSCPHCSFTVYVAGPCPVFLLRRQLYRRTQQQAGFVMLAEREFSQAKLFFHDSAIDVREVECWGVFLSFCLSFCNTLLKSWSYRQTNTTDLNRLISPESEGGQIHFKVVSVSWSSKNETDTKCRFVGVEIFYSKHPLAYPQAQFQDMWWSRGLSPYHNVYEMWCINWLRKAGSLHYENPFRATITEFPNLGICHMISDMLWGIWKGTLQWLPYSGNHVLWT